jgi:hypothetical protein
MSAMSIVTEQSRFGTEKKFNYPSLVLNEIETRDLQDCVAYNGDILESPVVRLADVRQLSELTLNDSTRVSIFLGKKYNNETRMICCAIKAYASIPKSEENPLKRKESISLYMNDEQLYNVLDIFKMSRSQFMSLPSPYHVIIRDEEKSQLILKINDNNDDEVSLKKVDLRVYYKNPDVEHLTSTKYGVTFYGYNQMKAFSDLRVEIDSIVTILRDFLNICSYVTTDISNRFVIYNSYCSEEVQREFISNASSYPHLLSKITEFIFEPNGLINYYSQNFLQYQSLMLKCHTRFNVEEVLEFNTQAIARELLKLYANGPIVIRPKEVVGVETASRSTDSMYAGSSVVLTQIPKSQDDEELDSTVEYVGDLEEEPDAEILAFLERIDSNERAERAQLSKTKKKVNILPSIQETTPTNKRKIPIPEKCKPKSKKKKDISTPSVSTIENISRVLSKDF